jgi:hypothetical protein
MKAVSDRFNHLFRSTRGLILVAIALIAIVTAMWGMLSGPLKEWGISDVAVRLYGMRLVEAEREGRIILLYHTMRGRLAAQGITRAGFRQKLSALLYDPLRFGMLWQMVYMNFVVTAVGIFMAIRLDAVIRKWPLREEQIALTGHWHILAGIIATIVLLLYADLTGLQGKPRQWFGWIVIIASDIAFDAVSLYETKRLFVSEARRQPLVDATILW